MRLLFLLALVSCSLSDAFVLGETPKLADKNIILFITDDQGQTLGCYGDQVAQTPNIDALAGDGTRFNEAFATTASCSASRSVVLSGLHNHKNGQYGHQHHFHKFASYHNVVSLALPRVLARAGYRTARCGKFHVAPESVYHFEEVIPGNQRNPVQMADNCQAFMTEKSEKPFFLYFATSDPHRGGGNDETSELKLKPNLFGNKKNKGSHRNIKEVFYKPEEVPVPKFLPDTLESRSELAQYYQSCSRIDAGLGRLVEILRQSDLYDRTMIVFTADHGMAFAGAKTTVYDPGLKVPFVVRDPYQSQRGVVSEALISHVDIAPSLLDFAGGLDHETNGPADWQDPNEFWEQRGEAGQENRDGRNQFRQYQGKSWIPILSEPAAEHHGHVFASHTFHEIQMYYPMRVIRDKKFKLIWNIAHKLDYPFASDLWAASSWQAQLEKGVDANYGQRTVGQYINRPKFELYDIENDPDEAYNLAGKPEYQELLKRYQDQMRAIQAELNDPWMIKWKYE